MNMHRFGIWSLCALLSGLLFAVNVSAQAGDEFCTACDGDWSPWTTVSGLDGLDFRTCRASFNDNSGAYNWYVEWRNRYSEDIFFDYAVTRTEAAPDFPDGRKGIVGGGYGCSWALSSRDDIFIWVDCVHLGQDSGLFYRCGSLCDCPDSEPIPDPDSGSVELQGQLSFRFQDDAAVIGAEKIDNSRNSGTRPLRLMFWATRDPYAGGAISGYRLADFSIGEIPARQALFNFESGTAYSEPPAGDYFLTITLTEAVNGSDIIIDYAGFEETKSFTGENKEDDSGSGCFIDSLRPNETSKDQMVETSKIME